MVSLVSTERVGGVIAPSAGGSLKRKQSDTEFDAENLTSSQLKRRRVTFDPTVDVHILPDVTEKSQELVREEVRRALERHASGDNAAYDQIRALFKHKPTSEDAPRTGLLQKYVIALTDNVPLLNHSCSGLVHGIIDTVWVTRNEPFVQSFKGLLRSLISIHPGYTSSILTMLVNLFVELPSPALRNPEDPAISRNQLQSRSHDTLRYLLRYHPMTSNHLTPIFTSTFPFPTDTVKAWVQYIRNVLKVSEYCPELKGSILSLVMQKLVNIDVQIQVDMEELEDDVEDHLMTQLDEADDDEDVSDDESVSSEESLDEEELRIKNIKDSVAKLDAIMDLLFSHFDSVFAQGDLLLMDHAFESLLSQFANIILPTYRSRHTQFLLFRFSQLSPDLVERFAGCCSHIIVDQRLPHILRTAAAAYLGSFVARGAHVSSSVVRDIFDLLCQHLEALRVSHEPSCKGPDLKRYGTYYAIAQALIYTFCFRWRDLIVTEDGTPPSDDYVVHHETDFVWYKDVQTILRRNIFSKLNPLKICAPSIVSQFAHMANHLRFLYIFPLIETNKRVRLAWATGSYLEGIAVRETALTQKKGEERFLLDAYFPFDPYLLPRSKRWVEKEYVEWKPVPGMKIERDEEEEDAEEEDDDEEDEESDSDREEVEHDEIDEGTGTDASI